jgi:hypothetical protein
VCLEWLYEIRRFFRLSLYITVSTKCVNRVTNVSLLILQLSGMNVKQCLTVYTSEAFTRSSSFVYQRRRCMETAALTPRQLTVATQSCFPTCYRRKIQYFLVYVFLIVDRPLVLSYYKHIGFNLAQFSQANRKIRLLSTYCDLLPWIWMYFVSAAILAADVFSWNHSLNISVIY